MSTRVLRALALLLAVGLAASSLAACGKRAPPDPPQGEPNEFPRTYPVDRG